MRGKEIIIVTRFWQIKNEKYTQTIKNIILIRTKKN